MSVDLQKIVAQMMQEGKGILAADESDSTAGKRLEMVHLPNEPEHRRAFRELLFTAPGIEEYLSGVILYDSTIRGETADGMPFADVLTARGMVPGIKVDQGAVPLEGFPGEVVTQGLDNLADRFKEYYALGARFAKWRAVISIDADTPTDECIEINAVQLARYAAIAQASNIVPMVEPEVIFAGDHSLMRAEEVTTRTIGLLMQTLRRFKVDLSATILKTSMVLAGDTHKKQSTAEEVADATLRTLRLSVPHDLGGVVFLSGGQSPKRATENLNAIQQHGKQPWPISSSFSRALEEPVLMAWQGKEENVELAQKALLYRAKMNGLAQQGTYDPTKDKQK